MSRRFQFSLKRLLAALTLGCLMLGIGHLCTVFVLPRVTAEPTSAGELISIHGRFFDFSGPEWQTCYVQIRKPTTKGGKYPNYKLCQNRGTQVKRHWGGLYTFDLELPPVEEPGNYRIAVVRLAELVGDKKTVWGSVVVAAKSRD